MLPNAISVMILIVKPAKSMVLIFHLSIILSLSVKLVCQASTLIVLKNVKHVPKIVWNVTMPKIKEKPAQCAKTLNMSSKRKMT
jgi:hypothetical protein